MNRSCDELRSVGLRRRLDLRFWMMMMIDALFYLDFGY